MLEMALTLVDTPSIYATIREGNDPSISLFIAHGFKTVQKANMENYKLLMLMKKNDTYKFKTTSTSQAPTEYGTPSLFTPPIR